MLQVGGDEQFVTAQMFVQSAIYHLSNTFDLDFLCQTYWLYL